MLKKLSVFTITLIMGLSVLNCSSDSQSTVSNKNNQSEVAEKAPENPPTASDSNPNAPKLEAPKLDAPKMHLTGKFLNGEDFDSYNYAGSKLLIAFFNYKNKNTLSLLETLSELQKYQNEKKFKILGVTVNYNEKQQVKNFLKTHKIDIPIVVDDADLSLAQKLNVNNEVSLVGLNNDHQFAFGLKKYTDPGKEGREHFLSSIKQVLKIDDNYGTIPYLGIHPQAPNFKTKTLAGKTIELNQFKGKVVMLLFFSPRCPHCQKEIRALKQFRTEEIKKAGLEIIAVSVLRVEGQTKALIDQFNMTDWHVVDDADHSIKDLFTQNTTIPEVFFIDREGKIRFHDTGYREPRHKNLNTMRLKKLLGLPNPPLLSSKTYNGVETCMICHEQQYVSWATTPHAHAWETLEVKGEEYNVECAGCHSLGMNDPKGWYPRQLKDGKKVAVVPEQFQNIQCEHCHGVGGAHMSMPKSETELKESCLECHTEKFSLHFDYHDRIQKVNHSEKEKIFNLSPEEKLNLLKKVAKDPHQLFGSKVKYVGSDTCIQCHTSVHKNWKESAHGNAFESLKKDNKTSNPACLKCHTVGYNQPGGYSLENNKKPNFEGVGCESCHGPGEKHIQSQKKSDIRSLGDDCPFCVVEQICLSCHDNQNDPDFNIYQGLEKIKGHK